MASCEAQTISYSKLRHLHFDCASIHKIVCICFAKRICTSYAIHYLSCPVSKRLSALQKLISAYQGVKLLPRCQIRHQTIRAMFGNIFRPARWVIPSLRILTMSHSSTLTHRKIYHARLPESLGLRRRMVGLGLLLLLLLLAPVCLSCLFRSFQLQFLEHYLVSLCQGIVLSSKNKLCLTLLCRLKIFCPYPLSV